MSQDLSGIEEEEEEQQKYVQALELTLTSHKMSRMASMATDEAAKGVDAPTEDNVFSELEAMFHTSEEAHVAELEGTIFLMNESLYITDVCSCQRASRSAGPRLPPWRQRLQICRPSSMLDCHVISIDGIHHDIPGNYGEQGQPHAPKGRVQPIASRINPRTAASCAAIRYRHPRCAKRGRGGDAIPGHI